MTIQDIMDEVRVMPIDERERLMQMIQETLDQPKVKKHSIMELAGLGAEIWEGVDAQEYVNQLRNEWDHRP